MPGDAAGAWGEAAEEFLTESVVSRDAPCLLRGLPTPFTCSADSHPAQGEGPRSAWTRAPVQSEKYSQGSVPYLPYALSAFGDR